jgi:hypothetical protein
MPNDFELIDHGTIVLVMPITDAAREWLEQHVAHDRIMWTRGSIPVEPRYVDNLVTGVLGDGMNVGAGQ